MSTETIFDFLSTAYYRIFGSTKLRAYEMTCLDAWKSKLSKEAAKVLNEQLSRYDFVQRLSKDKLVSFHYLRDKSYQSWPDGIFFPLRADEGIVVAVIGLSNKEKKKRSVLKANIVLFRGRISSIEFHKVPRGVFTKDTRTSDIEIADINILVDPMDANVYATESIVDVSELIGRLPEWSQKWEINDMRKPLSLDKRRKILQQLDTSMPVDYLNLIGQVEGIKIGPCVIHGLTQIRSIVLPQLSLYVLAEIADRGVVGVKQGGKECELYYVDNEDERPTPVGASLRAVIEKELQ